MDWPLIVVVNDLLSHGFHNIIMVLASLCDILSHLSELVLR